MFPFLGPPHDIQLASAIRWALVIAWWLMPLVFLLCAVHFSRRGDRKGRRVLAWHGLVVLAGLLLSVLLQSAAVSFAVHGNDGLVRALVSTGTCLFAPDTFCSWPELQLVIVPAIYLLLLRLVFTRRASRPA